MKWYLRALDTIEAQPEVIVGPPKLRSNCPADRQGGYQGDLLRADPYELYGWQRVQEAIESLGGPNTAGIWVRIAVYHAKHGTIEGFGWEGHKASKFTQIKKGRMRRVQRIRMELGALVSSSLRVWEYALARAIAAAPEIEEEAA